jgi:type IX secretion system PorP/SprF family membrane protein
MTRKIKILALLVAFAFGANGQDVHFSQFYENAIMRNPALTGIFSGDYKAGVDYRNQWATISVPFQTELVSFEMHTCVNKEVGDYLSFGLAGTFDQAGSINFNSMQVYPAINYNKALEDKHNTYLSVGFAAGYINRSVDMSKMTFSSQWINGNYNGAAPTGEILTYRSLHAYDLASGISLNSSLGKKNRFNYYLGVGAYHINHPTEIFSGSDVLIKLPIKIEGNAGFHYAINEQYGLTVHANYSSQNPYHETILGGLLSWRNLTIAKTPVTNFAFYMGVFVRFKDAIIPTIKIDYGSTSFGLSYDVNNSGLVTASSGQGGYEMSVYVRAKYKHKVAPEDLIKCPRFEEDAYTPIE